MAKSIFRERIFKKSIYENIYVTFDFHEWDKILMTFVSFGKISYANLTRCEINISSLA